MTLLADPRFGLGDREVVATLTVRGSNTPELTLVLRLSSGTGEVEVHANC